MDGSSDFLKTLAAQLTGVRRPFGHAPFSYETHGPIEILEYLTSLEEYFRPSSTTSQKVEFIIDNLGGDAREKVTVALESHASAHAKARGYKPVPCGAEDQDLQGDVRVFTTPYKSKRFLLHRGDDDEDEPGITYDPSYPTLRAVVVRAVLGKQSLQILSSHLETFRQGSSPIKRHIASSRML